MNFKYIEIFIQIWYAVPPLGSVCLDRGVHPQFIWHKIHIIHNQHPPVMICGRPLIPLINNQ